MIHDLKLAVTEACTNSIQHAYPDGTGAEDIVVRVSVGPGSVTVEVADDGIGFDPDGVAFVLTPDGERERGMGLPIIRTVMDTLVIHAKERGSRLVFSKRFEMRLGGPAARSPPQRLSQASAIVVPAPFGLAEMGDSPRPPSRRCRAPGRGA